MTEYGVARLENVYEYDQRYGISYIATMFFLNIAMSN
jgi:hypothetical protein